MRARPNFAPQRTGALAVCAMVAAIAATTAVTTFSVPAQAASKAEIQAFNARPRAAVALRRAKAYAQQGRAGKAVNWAERAVWCRDSTAAQRAAAAKLQERLKWRLRDAGFGVVEVQVGPEGAVLSVDGQVFRPLRTLYRLWLPKGSHQLEVKKPDFHTFRSIITAKPGETRPLRVQLSYAVQPVVTFLVKPVTAEIWRAKDFLGFSTKRTFTLPAGKSLIEVRAPGYTSWVRTLTLKAGDKRTYRLFLDRAVTKGKSRPSASNVQRKLTPLELANRGERHRLGRRPVDAPRHRVYRGAGGAPEPMKQSKPDWKKVDGKGGSAPASDADEPPPPPDDDGGDEGDLGDDGGDVGGGDSGGEAGGADTSVSGTLSNATKGWIYSGIGLALLAGGAGTSIYGVAQANDANGLPLGSSAYDSTYAAATNMTYAGYGSAGVGAISLVVGGFYLFSEGGLSRRGRGFYLLGTGLVTGLVGGWLVLDAVQSAETANSLPLRHHTYDTRFDGAESNWRAGVIAGGVGGVVALVGAWMALTGGDGGDSADAGSWWDKATLMPTLGPRRAGLALTF